MNWQSLRFDWNQTRAFLATAEEGSLSAAARALGQTQPTLGRQIASLEAELGVTLFDRAGRSLTLTPTGIDLLDHVRVMGEAASRISLAAAGHTQNVTGNVTITTTDVFAVYHLPPILARLRKIAPGLQIELNTDNALRDIRHREADIAIRHKRPEQPELIAKKLSESHARLYAARSYLDRHGPIREPADLAHADLIDFDNSGRLLTLYRSFGLPVTAANFKFRSANGLAAWAMVRQGLGVAIMSREVANMTPEVEAILPEIVAPTFPVWLATHRELKTSPRIRIVFDLLAEALAAK